MSTKVMNIVKMVLSSSGQNQWKKWFGDFLGVFEWAFGQDFFSSLDVLLTRDVTVTARANFRFSIAAALPSATQGPNSSSMTCQIVWRQLQEISQELEEVQYLHPPPLRPSENGIEPEQARKSWNERLVLARKF
ncbi:hypothetical protein B0H10DRAFT_1961946 [Mycena sp. CBHHK59/15]|nr:hypothetical protein B0H10DRAFT_1961946 [Mycena sp. CBHHK59/15]